MRKLTFLLAFLFILPAAFAHGEGGESKFIGDYKIEFFAEADFPEAGSTGIAFAIEDTGGGRLQALMDLEIYRNGNLVYEEEGIATTEAGFAETSYRFSIPGRYELRPIFRLGNLVASRQFVLDIKEPSRLPLIAAPVIIFGIIAAAAFTKKMKKTAGLSLAALVIVAGAAAAVPLYEPRSSTEEHIHADFKVFLEGQELNFSQQKYMTGPRNVLSDLVHLHDMNGSIIHVHAKNVNLDLFFGSIGMKLDNNCFITDSGAEYCKVGNKTLHMYVNGVRNEEYGAYVPKDLDRILITYGDLSQQGLQQQLQSVTGDACIQSLKCPERGPPSDESSCTAAGCEV
jgi:hypothetical protein